MSIIKRILSLLLCVNLFFCMSCDESSSETTTTDNATSQESALANGQIAYENLNLISSLTDSISSSVYEAWYFSVSRYNKYDLLVSADAKINDLAVYVKLPADILSEEISNYIITQFNQEPIGMNKDAMLMQPQMLIPIIINVYTKQGVIDCINSQFTEAKNAIKEIPSNYEGTTELTKLKEYYAELLSYYQFVTSPSGTLDQLDDTIGIYQTNISKLQNDLNFTYEK